MKRFQARAYWGRGRAEAGGERWSCAGSKAIKEHLPSARAQKAAYLRLRGQATAAREQHEGKPQDGAAEGVSRFCPVRYPEIIVVDEEFVVTSQNCRK